MKRALRYWLVALAWTVAIFVVPVAAMVLCELALGLFLEPTLAAYLSPLIAGTLFALLMLRMLDRKGPGR